jgi:hypothetical protein
MHIANEILIPPTIKSIEDRTFYGCSQLTTAIVGKGLEEIGEGAFAHCTLLND